MTLIPGDGVGAEITDSVKEIFEAVNAPIEWDQYNVSGMSSTGEDLFKQAMDSLKRNRVGLKGMFNLFYLLMSGLLLISYRYPFHPDFNNGTYLLECCYETAVGHLCICCFVQVPSGIPDSPLKR